MYRKGALHRTEIERLLLAAKGVSTNLVHFLPPYHVIISNMYIYSFTGTISHIYGCVPKTVLHAQNLMYKIPFSNLKTSNAEINKFTLMLWAWCEQCLATITQTNKAVIVLTLRKLSYT